MKVDFHFHLEEGPYSNGWLLRTAQALENVLQQNGELSAPRHSLEWVNQITSRLKDRIEKGCFEEEWVFSYFQLGMDKGIQHFGLVDHLYRFQEFRPYYEKFITLDDSPLGMMQKQWLDRVCVYSIEPFLDIVHRAKQQGYPVSLGVEADYFPGGEEELASLLSQYHFDYIIGSIHFLDGWGFDNPETKNMFAKKDLLSLYKQLFDTVKLAAKSGLFHMIGHLDNLKVFNYRPDEKLLLPLYEEVAYVLREMDIATEINTGLAYRYPVKEACPSPAFLKILKQHNVPITLSSDAHFPDDIGTLLDEAVELLKRSGYSEIVYFKEGKRITTSL